ncbi:CoA transferase [Pseudonocardia nematodicida]|uniref:CoA transferase n=1 Tax=Pseudonocardia nematodicida TaxID=1206997 RepID=A0ABV1K558_9PSEU
MTGADDESGGPLDGVRVVDLSSVVMGPLATSILADLGADVVKVEPPGGDVGRHRGTARSDGMSGLALGLHKDKRSVVLDLAGTDGRTALDALLRDADSVVMNLRPASRTRMGLDPASLRAAHPRLVVCTAQAFGSDSSRAERPGYDDTVQAASGTADLFRLAGGDPQLVPTILADKVCGLTIAYSLLAALLHRERTGRGQWVDVPMVDTMIGFNLVEHLDGGTFRPPAGEVGWSRVLTAGRGPHRTADGWISILPYTHRDWERFLSTTGRRTLLDDPRFATPAARAANLAALMSEVSSILVTEPTGHWIEHCARHGIAAERVLRIDDVADDPYVRERGLVVDADHPSEGPYRYVTPAPRFSASPPRLRRHAPRAGADTRSVLEDLGLPPAMIDRIVATAADAEQVV